MKRFSKLNEKEIKNKKYFEKPKEDIYSLIKESLSVDIKPINESAYLDNVDVDLGGTEKLVENLNKHINDLILKERIRTLQSIKSSISTGTLSIQKINEEIESCTCSETCPVSGIEDEEEVVDDYVEDEVDDDGEFVDVLEEKSVIDIDMLSDGFIDIIEKNKARDLTWEKFFDDFNIEVKYRTNSLVSKIQKDAKEKRPSLF